MVVKMRYVELPVHEVVCVFEFIEIIDIILLAKFVSVQTNVFAHIYIYFLCRN